MRLLYRRAVVLLLCLLTCAGLMFGFLSLPLLAREHQRLETWKAVLIWFGDVNVLFWFLSYTARVLIGHDRLDDAPVPSRESQHRAILAIVGALLIDVAITLLVMYGEKSGYDASEIAVGQIRSLKAKSYGGVRINYELTCAFLDMQGNQHEAFLAISETGNGAPKEFPVALDQATQQALRAGVVPFAVTIRYDPNFPKRVWFDGLGWDGEDRIYWWSLLIDFCQLPSLALFFVLVHDFKKRHHVYPWWHELYRILPLVIEGGFSSIFGLLYHLD
jgi:hypothetical protein